LVGLVLIVDSRRGLGAQDVGMLEWILARDRQAHVLLTKADKLNRREAQKILKETCDACSDSAVSVQLFSVYEARGETQARAIMERWLGIGQDSAATTN
jgi:GTP-binding protein